MKSYALRMLDFQLLRDAWLRWHPNAKPAERLDAIRRIKRECGL